MVGVGGWAGGEGSCAGDSRSKPVSGERTRDPRLGVRRQGEPGAWPGLWPQLEVGRVWRHRACPEADLIQGDYIELPEKAGVGQSAG